MKLVIDTNIILVSISEYSPYYWVFQSLLNKEYTLCITNEILFEYEEIISLYMGKRVAALFLEFIDNHSHIECITRYFKWELIKNDLDDNKFVDCAIACNANYLVTNDKHFNVLREIPFPKVNTINLYQLDNILRSKR